jgi:hypothetical protein
MCCTCCGYSFAQKTLILRDVESTKREQQFNLKGSEMYLVTVHRNIFIPKTAEFEFTIDKKTDSLIANDTTGKVYFLIRTSKYDYRIMIDTEDYRRCPELDIEIIKMDGDNYYAFTFLCGEPPISATAQLLGTKPNLLWKNKYTPMRKKY